MLRVRRWAQVESSFCAASWRAVGCTWRTVGCCGTMLNGGPCREDTILNDGDTIGVGTSRLAFLNDSFQTAEEARAHLESLGKGEATQSDDAWPLDPPWKTQTLSE